VRQPHDEQSAADAEIWEIVTGLEAMPDERSGDLARLTLSHGVGKVSKAMMAGRQVIDAPDPD
jgi:hypothetical protein